MKKARFRLDEDSICYGCIYFKNIEDTDIDFYDDDVLEGGICTCKELCGEGHMNGYRKQD